MILLLLLLAVDSVENGIKPKQALNLSLVKELTLGDDEQDENQLFTNGSVVAADPQGTMYVLDPGNFRIVVFSKEGTFQRRFGAQGQGPGEFQQPSRISISPENEIYISDPMSKKFVIFKADGTLSREIPFEQGIVAVFGQLGFLKGGNLLLGTVKLNANFQSTYDLSLYDAEMKVLKIIYSLPQPPTDWSQAQNEETWIDFLKNQFEAVGKGVPLGITIGNDRFAAVRTDLYQGTLYNPAGEELVHFKKDYKRMPLTPEARSIFFESMWDGMKASPFLANNLTKSVFEKACAKAEMPDHLSPISILFPIGEHFATISNYKIDQGRGMLELFDRGGHFLGSCVYEGNLLYNTGAGKNLYAVGNDDDDNLVISRYLLKGI